MKVTSKVHPDVMRRLLAQGHTKEEIERVHERISRSLGRRVEG
jgi:hypothetical protein